MRHRPKQKQKFAQYEKQVVFSQAVLHSPESTREKGKSSFSFNTKAAQDAAEKLITKS